MRLSLQSLVVRLHDSKTLPAASPGVCVSTPSESVGILQEYAAIMHLVPTGPALLCALYATAQPASRGNDLP
jgi:hypothetical protein